MKTIDENKPDPKDMKTFKADYTFDGVYFENIDKIGAFLPIINLKNVIKQNNQKERNDCNMILRNQHPQLFEFMKKHRKSFENFFKPDNNALLTLLQNN